MTDDEYRKRWRESFTDAEPTNRVRAGTGASCGCCDVHYREMTDTLSERDSLLRLKEIVDKGGQMFMAPDVAAGFARAGIPLPDCVTVRYWIAPGMIVGIAEVSRALPAVDAPEAPNG